MRIQSTFFPLVTVLVLVTAAMPVSAACPSSAAGRFEISGPEIIDTKTGLIWSRCSVGQNWNGNDCTGNAANYTHEQALEYAASQSGWRLPSVKELASLVDKECVNPAIDIGVFPNTVTDVRYWSATPYAGTSTDAWDVGFNFGGSYHNNRGNQRAVRLVRASQ